MCVATHTPSLPDVEQFFSDRGRSTADADKFFQFNAAKGWKNGRTPIADWQALAEMWIASAADVNRTHRDEPEEVETDQFGRPIPPKYEKRRR